jgi:HEAT repeat protein
VKRIFIAIFIASLAARAETFDAKKATFLELFTRTLQPGDSPQHAAWSAAAYAELEARGPETLSNLMDRIHIENVMIGVYAINMTKDRPIAKNKAVPVLASFLTAERPVTRKMAAYLMSFYFAPEQADNIYPLLSHEKTRGAAIRALGKWHITNAVSRIEPFLHDGKERIRIATANALRDIADPLSVPLLIDALGDSEFTVRNTAARALITFGPAAVVPLVDALAKITDTAAKRQIIRCLGELKDPRATPALRQLAEKSDGEMNVDTQHALDLIAGTRSDIWFGPGGE